MNKQNTFWGMYKTLQNPHNMSLAARIILAYKPGPEGVRYWNIFRGKYVEGKTLKVLGELNGGVSKTRISQILFKCGRAIIDPAEDFESKNVCAEFMLNYPSDAVETYKSYMRAYNYRRPHIQKPGPVEDGVKVLAEYFDEVLDNAPGDIEVASKVMRVVKAMHGVNNYDIGQSYDFSKLLLRVEREVRYTCSG